MGGDEDAKHAALFSVMEEFKSAGLLPASVSSESSQPMPSLNPSVKGGRVMVFCNTIPSARSTAHALAEAGFSLSSLHGGIPPQLREREFAAFRDGLTPLLVCTDAASRGLDLPSVSATLLFDFPRNAVDYLHRIGRTGRAGKEGLAVSLVQKCDAVLATAIDRAVASGKPLDSLSSDTTAYVHPKVLAGNAARRAAAAHIERPKKHAALHSTGGGSRSAPRPSARARVF